MNRLKSPIGGPKSTIGLDIGTDSFKFVKLKKRGKGYILLSYGLVPIPKKKKEINKDSQIDPEDILRELLYNEIDKCPIHINISGPEVAIKSFTIPFVQTSKLDNTIFWTGKKFVPFSLEESSFDYTIIGELEEQEVKKKKVLLVAVPKRIINSRLTLLNSIGIKVSRITTPSFALNNLIKYRDNTPPNYALIDIGSASTIITLAKDKKIFFSREIITSGKSISESISYSTSSDFVDAEKIKHEIGLSSDLNQLHIQRAIKPVIERLINEIDRSFTFYKQNEANYSIDKIYLTGGTVLMPGFAQFMETRFGRDVVEVLQPFENIEILPTIKNKDRLISQGPLLAQAIGLAIEKDSEIDLLPLEIKQKKAFSSLFPKFLFITSVVIVILSFLSFYQANIFKNSTKEFNSWKEATQSLVNREANLTKDMEEQFEYKRLKQIITYLQKEGIEDPIIIFKEISDIIPDCITLENIELSYPEQYSLKELYSNKTDSKGNVNDASNPSLKGTVNLKGIVCGNELSLETDLLSFAFIINSSPFFTHSQIVSQERALIDNKTTLKFSIKANLE